MKKLKIAQVTPYYYPSIGGVSGVAKYISEELASRGHLVNAITAHKDHAERPPLQAPKHEIINGVNVFRYKSILNIGHMSIMPSLIPHFIKHKYDVIHYHSYRHPLCDVSAFFGKIKSSVNVLHGHGPFFERGEIPKLKHFIYDTYDKFASLTTLAWTDKLIASNDHEFENYLRLTGKKDKITIILNAASSESFKRVDPEKFIEKYNLKNKKIILCLGIINESKRQDILVSTLPKIIKEVPDAFIILVGPDGGQLENVKNTAAKLGVANYYKYLGPVSDQEKQEAFCAAKIFSLTSDKDHYPLVISEAMAHGLPVVATDARGPKAIIHDGVDGIIIKKQDVSGIAGAIIRLMKNENIRLEMGKNARANAEKNHSARGITDQFEEIYYEILKKKMKTIN